MIKIRCRKNLLYLFIYYISAFIDYTVLGTIFYSQFNFNPIYVSIYIYPLENIIGGLIVYFYQRNSVKKNGQSKYFGFELVQNQKKVVTDGKFKKILLIFIAAYFNYYNLIVSTIYFTEYIPWSTDLRISSIQIISSALICAHAFGFEFKKHHKVSIIIISIFLFLSICLDMLYIIIYNYKNIKVPIIQYFLSLDYYIGYSFNNCIEKYLVDVDYMNPFLILMLEGVFQILFAFLTIVWTDNPLALFKNEKVKNNLTLFIFLFIAYVIFQIVVNIYRIYCNVIYSPMARSLIDYFLNPFINIFFFFYEKEFFDNSFYFGITEFFCCIMSFFGCVFNEYIVLYCCGLECETQDEINDRAKVRESEKPKNQTQLQMIIDTVNNENDANNNSVNNSNTIITISTNLLIKI